MIIHNNLDTIIRTLTANIVSCVNHKTFADRADGDRGAGGAAPIVSGTQVFKPVVVLFIEYVYILQERSQLPDTLTASNRTLKRARFSARSPRPYRISSTIGRTRQTMRPSTTLSTTSTIRTSCSTLSTKTSTPSLL